MGPFDGALKGKNYKTLAVKKEKIITAVRPSQPANSKTTNGSSTSSSSSPPSSYNVNGKSKPTNSHVRSESRSLTPSHPGDRNPKNVVKNERSSFMKRPSPAVSTPHFDDSESDIEEEQETRNRKRPKLERGISGDSIRRITNLQS